MQLHPLNNETGILSPSTTMRYVHVIPRPLILPLPGQKLIHAVLAPGSRNVI